MSVPLAYLGVIVVWATTPLAIDWSNDIGSVQLALAGRMLLSLVVALLWVRLFRVRLPWHRGARRTYLAAGLGIFMAMSCVYWSAQFVPSGWISVLFGLTPIFTGLMAARWLGESALSPEKLLGMALGVSGLAVIFAQGLDAGGEAVWGVIGVLVSTFFHSGSAVWIKRIDAHLSPIATVTGALAVCTPLFLLSAAASGAPLPAEPAPRAVAAIVYLGVFGSVFGFSLYYYVLRHVEAGVTALITLITPVTALFLGHVFNGEPLTPAVWGGTALVLAGLSSYQFGRPVARRLWQLVTPG